MKKKIQKWLEIEETYDYIVDDIKDKVLFELSFIDKMSLGEENNSKLYHCNIVYFLKKDSSIGKYTVYNENRYYRANSRDEAYGAFIRYLKSKNITPEELCCSWNPIVNELDPDCFISIREED